MRTIYRQAAQIAYKRLNAIAMDEEVEVPKAFVADFADRIVSLIPPAEGLSASFGFDYFPFLIPLPSLLDSEARKIAMNDALAERYLKEKSELIDGFLVDVQAQLHELVSDVASGVLQAMKKNEGKLLGPSAVRLKNLVGQVSQLNFYDDAKLQQLVDQVKAQIDRDAPKRDVSEIKTTLKELSVLSQTTLLDLSRVERQSRSEAMEEVVAAEVSRQSREEGLVEAVVPLENARQMRLPLEVA